MECKNYILSGNFVFQSLIFGCFLYDLQQFIKNIFKSLHNNFNLFSTNVMKNGF